MGRKNAQRNMLERDGIICKELRGHDGLGFIVRVLNSDTVPPQVTIVTRQPEHSTTTIETLTLGQDRCFGPEGFLPKRWSPATPTQPEDLADMTERLRRLQDNSNSLADIALRFLSENIVDAQLPTA